jgi:hypothetical protein
MAVDASAWAGHAAGARVGRASAMRRRFAGGRADGDPAAKRRFRLAAPDANIANP